MSVGQYLQHYAEPETHEVTGLTFYYENILTIPAFNEPEALIDRLKNIEVTNSLLIILVVNAPDGSNSPAKLESTQALAKNLKQQCPCLQEFSPTINLLELDKSPKKHIILVERCHSDKLIPAKEGVGLARKIACDIACKMIAIGQINSHWIHNTDADVTLPAKYFDVTKTISPIEVAVALYPFEHKANSNPLTYLCQQLYDISLYYYVEGLNWAQSPYAFHTIGSTLLINFNAYALVRGFPKRAAGEDFYLLNKMAKFSDILSLNEPVITIDSRQSDRVPFGTGPALIKMSELADPLQDYHYYNPLCFEYLKTWLLLLPQLWDQEIEEVSLSVLQSLVKTKDDSSDLELLLSCLRSLKTDKALKHAIQQSNTPENFERHMHNWFDAFKTLKFIHCMRDLLIQQEQFPCTAANLLDKAEFLSDNLKQKIKVPLQHD